jgi:hypothetical protein
MNTCDTCKWWGDKDISAGENMSFCEKDLMPGIPDSIQAEDIPKFSGYARIVTGPKFGCIHHEPK